METSTLLGIGLLGAVSFMAVSAGNGDGGIGGGGGFGEAIEEAVETPGLTVNVPDYTELIKALTTPMRTVTEPFIPDVPTKKDVYVPSSKELSTAKTFFDKYGPVTPQSMKIAEAKKAFEPYGPVTPPSMTDAYKPKTSFLGGIFGGPYHFKPDVGQKSFLTGKVKKSSQYSDYQPTVGFMG